MNTVITDHKDYVIENLIRGAITARRFVSFGAIQKILYGDVPYVPSHTEKILEKVAEMNPKWQAVIVDRKGRHSEKVAASHRQILESWGYTQFPEVKKPRKVREI
jgi:hypothetical protein